jgi:hypothetical protein
MAGDRFPAEIFLFLTASIPALGPTQNPIQWIAEALSSGVKRSGREADHSPPSTSDVKNAWSYTSTEYVFMASNLVKHRDNFTFTCQMQELQYISCYAPFIDVTEGVFRV